MEAATWKPENVDVILDQWLAGKLERGEQVYAVAAWRNQARDRILKNEQAWPGYIESTVRGMSSTDEQEHGPVMLDARELMRRLADAKLAELTRYGVKDPDRTRIAVDYACGAVHSFRHAPFPAGGLGELEDELYRELGFDRITGVRFNPKGAQGTA